MGLVWPRETIKQGPSVHVHAQVGGIANYVWGGGREGEVTSYKLMSQ